MRQPCSRGGEQRGVEKAIPAPGVHGEKEFVGDNVTMDVVEVIDHHGDIIVRARHDGTYDRRGTGAGSARLSR